MHGQRESRVVSIRFFGSSQVDAGMEVPACSQHASLLLCSVAHHLGPEGWQRREAGMRAVRGAPAGAGGKACEPQRRPLRPRRRCRS